MMTTLAQYHRQQLTELEVNLPEALSTVIAESQKQELMENLKSAYLEFDNGEWSLLQYWMYSFIGNHPQFTPLIPRDLLWYLGNDCLHFLTDDEISQFQRVEDKVEEGMDWESAKRTVFNH